MNDSASHRSAHLAWYVHLTRFAQVNVLGAAVHLPVDAPEVNHEAVVDKDPEVVVALELVELAPTVRELALALKGEEEVVGANPVLPRALVVPPEGVVRERKVVQVLVCASGASKRRSEQGDGWGTNGCWDQADKGSVGHVYTTIASGLPYSCSSSVPDPRSASLWFAPLC